MKPLPVPDVPGNTPWERMDNAVRSIFNVTKDALVKAETRLKKKQSQKPRSKKPPRKTK